MYKNIETLLKKYKIQDIESGLIKFYLKSHKIKVQRNLLLRSILEEPSSETDKIADYLTNNTDARITLSDLVQAFELLIPKDDKKINGAIFTPKFITNFIVKESIQSQDQKICDPSCGCGAFLIEAVEFIHKKYSKNISQIIEQNIYGVDIAEYSIKRARILLSILAVENNEDSEKYSFNLTVADSLNIKWFKEIFQNINGFDLVIGNPPYVKFQDLSKETRQELNKNWNTLKTGNYNLYFAFFELGIDILDSHGTLVYITPNNYFTSLAGIHLREYLSQKKIICKIIDFNHLKLFNVQTYTCITFLQKNTNDSFLFERVDNYQNLKNLCNLEFSKIYYDSLNNKKWRLIREKDKLNIKKIETIGTKLGAVADIRVGIATCKDQIYFIDGKTLKDRYYKKEYNGSIYEIEEEITRPIAKTSDFSNQSDLEKNTRRIIFPYWKNNGQVSIIPENDLKNKFPKCYDYLLNAKGELSSRDKGISQYPEWYAYARTQGLNFDGEKLLTPTFSSKPRFLFEKNSESLFCNGYGLFRKKEIDLFGENLNLSILSKILNSKIMEYYIRLTSVSIEGGYPCYQKNFIELFSIPEFNVDEKKYLSNENSKDKIDSFLINKYKLNIND